MNNILPQPITSYFDTIKMNLKLSITILFTMIFVNGARGVSHHAFVKTSQEWKEIESEQIKIKNSFTKQESKQEPKQEPKREEEEEEEGNKIFPWWRSILLILFIIL